MALRSLFRPRQPSLDGRVHFIFLVGLWTYVNFVGFELNWASFSILIWCLFFQCMCMCVLFWCLFLLTVGNHFPCIPWNKAVEVEGGGEEGLGSDLKSLYIYSPSSFWLSSIRRLMGSIFGWSSTSVSSKPGCLWPLIKNSVGRGIWLKMHIWGPGLNGLNQRPACLTNSTNAWTQVHAQVWGLLK